MSRFLKWTIGIFAVLAVLVAGAALAVRFFLSSEQMKNLALAQGQELLGRRLQLKELSIGLFGIKASGLVIEKKSGARGGDNRPLLRVDEIDVLINPTALLYKKLSILSFTFEGVEVNVSRDETGRFSFQDILDRTAKVAAARPEWLPAAPSLIALAGISSAEAAPSEGGGPAQKLDLKIVVRDLEFRDVRVNFESAAFGGVPAFRARCRFESIEIDELSPGSPLPIEAAGKCAEPGVVDFVAEGTLDPVNKVFQGAVTLKPFDVMPFVRLAPPLKGVRPRSGTLGGKAAVVYSNGNLVVWDVDLKGANLDADLQIPESKAWRRRNLENFHLRSKGNFDLEKESAEISALLVEVPFAQAKLKKISRWNVSERDEIHLDLKVQDIAAAVNWAGPFLDLPLGNLKGGGEVAISLSASRDRRKGNDFAIASSIKFSPMEIGPYAGLLPPMKTARRIRGKWSGEAEISFSAARRAGWKVNLRGESVSVEIRNQPKQKWRSLRLAAIEVRSEGNYDLKGDAAEIASLEIELPFGTTRLTQKAVWNVSGRDAVHLDVKISDIGAAARIAAAASGFVLKEKDIPKNKKIDLKLSVSRDRKAKKQPVSVSGSAVVDPIEIAPFAGLVPASAGLRKMRGVIGGKASFSLKPEREATWAANLSGSGLSGEMDLDSDGKWSRLRLESFKIDTAGRYNIRNDSALIERLDVKLPFGSVNLMKKGRWNVAGVDEIDVKWAVPDLAAAVKAAKPIIGDLANLADPDGSARGSLRILRNRKKGGTFSVTGSVDADLKRVHLPDRPNLALRGKTRVELDGKSLALSVPLLVIRERGRPKAPDAVVLEDFRVSLSQKDLWEGRYVALKATAKALRLNISMNPEKKTNLGAILKSKKAKALERKNKKSSSIRSRPGSRRANNKSAEKKTVLVAQAKRPSSRNKSLPTERVAKNLPVVKIKLIEIANMDILFVHDFEKGNPPIRLEWKNLNLRVDGLDTRMPPGKLDTRIRLTAPGNPPALLFDANANPGVTPPALRGTIAVNRFDLRLVSPYAEQVRGMKIRRGTVNLSSNFKIRRNYLKARAKATVFDLDLTSMRRTPLLDDAQIFLQQVAIRLLKRDNSQIPVKVKIEGQLDDPSFYIVRALTESILASVFEKIVSLPGGTKRLGGDLKGILKDVLGGTLGLGGGGARPGPPQEESLQPKQVIPGKPVIPGGTTSDRKRSLKDLESLGNEILKGLFGR